MGTIKRNNKLGTITVGFDQAEILNLPVAGEPTLGKAIKAAARSKVIEKLGTEPPPIAAVGYANRAFYVRFANTEEEAMAK